MGAALRRRALVGFGGEVVFTGDLHVVMAVTKPGKSARRAYLNIAPAATSSFPSPPNVFFLFCQAMRRKQLTFSTAPPISDGERWRRASHEESILLEIQRCAVQRSLI